MRENRRWVPLIYQPVIYHLPCKTSGFSCKLQDNSLTAPFNKHPHSEVQNSTVTLFTAVNHCTGPLSKQNRLAQRSQMASVHSVYVSRRRYAASFEILRQAAAGRRPPSSELSSLSIQPRERHPGHFWITTVHAFEWWKFTKS